MVADTLIWSLEGASCVYLLEELHYVGWLSKDKMMLSREKLL